MRVVGNDFGSVFAHTAFVIGNDGGQTENQAFGQLAFALQVNFQAGEVAGLIFGERVEHDRGYLMVDERVVEAVEHIVGKLHELLFREVESLQQLVEHHTMDIASYNGVLASVAYDIDTREICHGRQYGVRAVEQRHLTLVIGLFRRYEQYVQTGFVGREFFGNLLRSLNYPEVKYLGLYYQVVVVLQFLFDCVDIFAGESRYDAVYQRCIYAASLLEPLFEVVTEVPQLYVLVNSLFQLVTVQEDKLTGEDDKTLAHVAIESFVATVEQLCQLAGI